MRRAEPVPQEEASKRHSHDSALSFSHWGKRDVPRALATLLAPPTRRGWCVAWQASPWLGFTWGRCISGIGRLLARDARGGASRGSGNQDACELEETRKAVETALKPKTLNQMFEEYDEEMAEDW